MRLYEHEGKKLFAGAGLTVPRQYGLIRAASELAELDVTYPAMLKAMVLTGGRGKAGGVRKAADAAEAGEIAAGIFDRTIDGYPVEILLVEAAAEEAGACYLGVTINPATYFPVVMASAAGGVDIEQVAVERPDAILRVEIRDNVRELPPGIARELGAFVSKDLGGSETVAEAVADAVSTLYAVFQKYECKTAEINPLLLTSDQEVIAADSKVVIDDNALYRQGEMFEQLGITSARHDVSELTRDEQRARTAGFPYVDLLPEGTKPDPDKLYVGLVPGGAGYGIFSIDEVVNVGDRFFNGKVVPVNFMDSGGGPPLTRVAEMFHLLMDKEIVDLVVTSRFGGISSCDVFIRGLIKCLRDRHASGQRMVPVHGRMVGTDLPSARKALEEAREQTPEPLAQLEIVVGNQEIMAEVIRDGLEKAFERKRA